MNKKMTIDPTTTNKSNKRLFGILIGISLTMITFLVLQVTIGTGVDGQGFNWKLSDFLIMGLLLFSTGLSCEIVLRSVKSFKKRVVIFVVILFALLLIWAELAVGIFGTPFAGS